MSYFFVVAYQLKDPATDEDAVVAAIKSGKAWAQMNAGTYIVESLQKAAKDVITSLLPTINQAVDSLSVIAVVRDLSATCDDSVKRMLGQLPSEIPRR